MGIMAEVKGKISSSGSNINDRQEDLLTSNVFQLLRYLPLELGLKPLLSRAVSINNKYFNLPGDAADFKIFFWDKYSNSEPDVHIKFYDKNNSVCMNIFVEVKYGSVKSGSVLDEEVSDLGQVDQLKREWDDLCHISKDIDCALVYLTADTAFPEGDINESAGAIGNEANLYWLNWQTVNKTIGEILEGNSQISQVDKTILTDIKWLLDHKELHYFYGWSFHKCSFSLITPFHYFSWFYSGMPTNKKFKSFNFFKKA